ncbi:MAG: class I SAM-dependent methyltransferase [Nocardioidaceae bacterium]
MSDELFRTVGADEAVRANRSDWDRAADDYQREHGEFLGDADFVWCPEGVRESSAGLLGEVSGKRVLEVGCGAAQCARWLLSRGAVAIGVDLSFRQLQHGRRIDAELGVTVPTVCGSVTQLPVAASSVDIVCSAFGAFPFVIDIDRALLEVAHVLRPGGLLVFSVVHPTRWMFPDDPTAAGLTVSRSYFDRTPYVESDAAGRATYVEAHSTLEDWTQALTGAGLSILGLHEPPWPPGHDRPWGAWGPERGAYIPGTLILSASKPARRGG